MKTKQKFTRTAQMLAHVQSQPTPQFVGAMDRLRAMTAFSALRARVRRRVAGDTRRQQLSLKQALLVKQAEFWLVLGKPSEALQELKRLRETARKDAWAIKMQIAAVHAAREQDKL